MALITFAVAVIALLYGPSRLEYPAPLVVLHASTVVDSLILAATFYASIGLIVGRRAAWRISILILLLAATWETIESREAISPLSIFPFIALTGLIATRRHYLVASGPVVLPQTLWRALFFTSVTTLIGCIAFYLLDSIEHRPFTLGASIIRALEQMYSLSFIPAPSHHLAATHYSGRLLLFGLGIVNYAVIAFALLRPVADSFHLTPLAHSRARHLIDRYGVSSEDYFKFFPTDKSYYFGQTVEGMVAYGVHKNICVALADPIAATPTDRQALLDEFLAFGQTYGWTVAFLGVEESSLPLYASSVLHQLKIGEAARIDLTKFNELRRHKNHRNIINRFSKAGFTTELTTLHHHPSLMRELQMVSDAWLNQGNRTERQFAMGYFDTHYLQQSQLFLVRDTDSKLVAFANLQPNFSNHRRASIDLMRLHPGAPTNTMDFLFLSLMEQLSANGWLEFDLGLAPLSGLAKGDVSERSLHLLFQLANRWFAFKGLRRFKDKFHPDWQPIYLIHSGPRSNIAAIGLAINELMKYQKR
jgi:phosphatidylglycerol lysyltransferase